MAISGSQKALMFATAGVLRAGAGRANYTSPKVFVAIAGVHYATGRAVDTQKVLAETLTISEGTGTTPSTCGFQVQGFQPSPGQDVVITLGSKNNGDRQFAGTILTEDHGYVGSAANALRTVQCTDYSWQLTRRRITKRYTNQSATAIGLDLVTYMPGFTGAIAPGLPVIDEISFTFDTILSAFTQVAQRIGGAVRVDYRKVIRLGLTLDLGTNPRPIASTNPLVTALQVTQDLTQVITRASVQGGGVNALGAAQAGDTLLAVEDTAWYNPAGGQVVCGPQRLTYAGIVVGGGGALVGPGVTPSSAATATLAVGSGVESGTHGWAYTWVTGAGESLPSPTTSLAIGVPTGPSAAPGVYATGSNIPSSDLLAGDTVVYSYSWSTATSIDDLTQETARSPTVTITAAVGLGGGVDGPIVQGVPSTDPRVKWMRVWKSVNGGSTVLAALDPGSKKGVVNTSAGFTIDTGAFVFTHSAATLNQAAIGGIAIGPSATTSRKVYRTVAGGTQLKLHSTIANNTATTLTDSTADASLGANAPTADTSGLTQPTGQVLAGSTTLLVAGAGAFSAAGGLAIIGNGEQIVHYTGISGNTLTGIPTTGSGSITATVSYNSTITAAPCLTGIPASGAGSILNAIARGDAVNVLGQMDDLTAQAALAALMGGGDDGVVEDYQQDGRISEAEALARARATLRLHGAAAVALSVTDRDNNVRGGRLASVSLTVPFSLTTTFVLQRVTVTNFQPALFPTRQASASDTYVGFSDLLRVTQQTR